jgi:murein DD-endopeptidase MepM/ murein hydrolase activator NlpD
MGHILGEAMLHVATLALLLAASAEATTSLRPEGGGSAPFLAEQVPCLDEDTRRQIEVRLAERTQRLEAQGLLPAATVAAPAGGLAWPLAPAPGLGDPGYHAVTYFVDLDPAYPGRLLDYMCGTRTYDTAAGYNHSGVDYASWPFGWLRMDLGLVRIVAAAPGVILEKSDGNDDRSCALGDKAWNAVYVRHGDGSVAWYGHMKKGSLTTKPVGATVTAGEYLGVVGSSGSSTEPHLHFEVHDAAGRVTEPHAGACGGAVSWWEVQRPYYDSAINALFTHSAAPLMPACPGAETPNLADVFAPGASATFATYYRDQRAGQITSYTIRKPDGTAFASWTHSTSTAHFPASYWYWTFTLPTGPPGTWVFEARYQWVTYSHAFAVGSFGPVVSNIAPRTGPTAGGQAVHVSGDRFAPGATLTIGGASATAVTVESATDLTAISPAHATGLGDVMVTNPDGLSGALSAAFFFTPPPTPTSFHTVTPCRAVDTREASGPTAGQPLPAGATANFAIGGRCGIPTVASAVSVNLTVVSPAAAGHVTVYPGNGLPGLASAINFVSGRTIANNAVALLATDGSGTLGVLVGSAGTLHLVVDVNGYFE